ncbi:hypothetical protein [Streptomyces antibioticus]|uniref:Uncharacterized protein n=1 Tax=Streptomyces antibioticus TaxID=1890 RepID=A0AAE6YF54_STRAT|nr:hypothetical protein [Streptomyces antibioticus]MBO7939263.1 hypothetical protein [Streptomyces sp. S9]OOQ48259.1 hypothetical protein AFM16_37565 [Streptomyces antibioticus]QIT48625.1 hypothetical protein HCX60_38205 [Streptomyces antibioticus]
MEAGDLTADHRQHTSSGTWVQTTAVQHHTEQTSVRNLTVEDLHTYYLQAAAPRSSPTTKTRPSAP